MPKETHNSQATAWLNPREVGELLPGNPSSVTIRTWCKLGRVPGAVQLPSGRWQIPDWGVQRLIDSINETSM